MSHTASVSNNDEITDTAFKRAGIIRVGSLGEMISVAKAFELLKGMRGHGPYDQEAFIDAVERITHLMASLPQVHELDLNPLRLNPQDRGAVALDARMKVIR